VSSKAPGKRTDVNWTQIYTDKTLMADSLKIPPRSGGSDKDLSELMWRSCYSCSSCLKVVLNCPFPIRVICVHPCPVITKTSLDLVP